MKIIKKIFQVLISPKKLILALAMRGFFNWMPDEMFLKMIFLLKVGYKLDLKNPQTFNEKLQWLKLYNRRPEYTTMVDKYAVKKYVADKIGEEYIIPTLGVWDKPEDIDFDKLPNQFVLKTTYGGGSSGVIICKDISKLNRSEMIRRLRKSLSKDLYKLLREWPYKNVPKRILAEKYMEDIATRELRDYKFFCFNGVVKALFVATERSTGDVKFDYFDSDFNHLDIVQFHPMSGRKIEKPKTFDEMKKLAAKLAVGIPHVRVDFYDINGKVYFGELTFTHHGGITPFHPEKWDKIFGDWLELPRKDISR